MSEKKKQWFSDYSEDTNRLEGKQNISDGKNHMNKGQNNHEELVEKEKEASRGRTHTHTGGGSGAPVRRRTRMLCRALNNLYRKGCRRHK